MLRLCECVLEADNFMYKMSYHHDKDFDYRYFDTLRHEFLLVFEAGQALYPWLVRARPCISLFRTCAARR